MILHTMHGIFLFRHHRPQSSLCVYLIDRGGLVAPISRVRVRADQEGNVVMLLRICVVKRNLRAWAHTQREHPLGLDSLLTSTRG